MLNDVALQFNCTRVHRGTDVDARALVCSVAAVNEVQCNGQPISTKVASPNAEACSMISHGRNIDEGDVGQSVSREVRLEVDATLGRRSTCSFESAVLNQHIDCGDDAHTLSLVVGGYDVPNSNVHKVSGQIKTIAT